MKTREPHISVDRLRELFEYDPSTGEVTRTTSLGRYWRGFVFDGLNIQVDGRWYRRSRISWALYHGEWPPTDLYIDHINGIRADNRIENLRLATPTQNQQNKAGYGVYSKGVTWRQRHEKPYQAKIRVDGKRIHLGSFATEEEASNAYQEACLKYHGEYACYD